VGRVGEAQDVACGIEKSRQCQTTKEEEEKKKSYFCRGRLKSMRGKREKKSFSGG